MCLATATLAQTVPNYVPSNGLVGWWPFNGNAIDESVNTNDGTVNGATLTADRFGNAGKAYGFNGINNNIVVNSNPSLNINIGQSLTVSCWLKHNLASANINKYFISKYSGISTTGESFALGTGLQGNGYTWHQIASGVNNGREIQGNNIINDGQWHFITSILEMGNNTKLYVDGILDSSVAFPLSGSIINSINLNFGCNSNNTYYYNGNLDDIGIWNRALTQQEITGLYTSNICYDHVTVTDTLIINTNMIGFNPVTYQNTIKVWPNPAHDHITIDNGNIANLNGYQIKISNVLGQQVFQSAINQQQFYINLSTWTGNGTYYINLINPQGVTVETRVIVVQ